MILFELVLNGLVLGSIYALVAAGLALIYGTMRLLNFAHGEFLMLGAFGVAFAMAKGLSPWVAVPTAGLLAALAGMVLHRTVLEPLNRKDGADFAVIATTLGISIFLQNAAFILFGEQFKTVEYFSEGVITIGDLRLPVQRALVVAIGLVVLVFAWAVLRFTPFGRAIRATSQDDEAARVVGVPVSNIRAWTFALGCGMAGIAGAVLAPIFAVNPWVGIPFMLKAFVVVVIGGLGSFPGAIVAGLSLGVIEALGVALTSTEWRDVISYSVLIAVIWWRPWGLFGVAER